MKKTIALTLAFALMLLCGCSALPVADEANKKNCRTVNKRGP